MSIREPWINEPDMNCAVSLARNLERRERARSFNVLVARQTVARKLRVGMGTLENLVRGRIKRVDAVILDRLRALLVRELESEIMRLTHELEIARQSGAHLASDEVGEIETHLARAAALLRLDGSLKRRGGDGLHADGDGNGSSSTNIAGTQRTNTGRMGTR